MTIKLEVGKRYELNNGEVHECTEMYGDDPLSVSDLGYGPFVIDGCYYHQDGTFARNCDIQKYRGVKRCVDDTLKLEPGKYYRTRDGRKVGPMKECAYDGLLCSRDEGRLFNKSDGTHGDRDSYDPCIKNIPEFDLIAEWTDDDTIASVREQLHKPKLWRDMTPEEKGALLLAAHEGKVIEYNSEAYGGWKARSKHSAANNIFFDDHAYRVKSEPVREVVIVHGTTFGGFRQAKYENDTHRITFDVIDGKPDCASVKMEEL